MRSIIFVILLSIASNLSTLRFEKCTQINYRNGTYTCSTPGSNTKYLRVHFFNDTVFAFTFDNKENMSNSSDTESLGFNYSADFGICKKINGQWFGYMDYSYMDREYGDFDVSDKTADKGIYNVLQFSFKDKNIDVHLIKSKTRCFVTGNYSFENDTEMNFKVAGNYRNIRYADIIYEAMDNVNLRLVPDYTITDNQILMKGEFVDIENEYKEFVFVVQYDANKIVQKYGWVKKDKLKKVKVVLLN